MKARDGGQVRERQAELYIHILVCSSTQSVFNEVLELAGIVLGAAGTVVNKVPFPMAHIHSYCSYVSEAGIFPNA